MIQIRFFTEASFNSGLGHLIRTITVVKQFIKDKNFHNENLKLFIKSNMEISRFTNGLENIVVVGNSDAVFSEVLKNNNKCINIFDILNCTIQFKEKFNSFKNGINISISPVSQINDQMDLIISRGFVEQNSNIKQIFGIDYSVIRDDIKRIKNSDYAKLIRVSRLNIGIAMGGSDPLNLSKKLVQTIKDISIPTTIWLAIGTEYKGDINHLFREIKASKSIDLVVGSVFNDLWDFLEKCKLVILQGGLCTTEAAFRGIPSLNIPRFNSQSTLNKNLFENNAAWVIEKDKLGSINKYIKDLISNESILINASLKGKELVDGLGALRVKKEIIRLKDKF